MDTLFRDHYERVAGVIGRVIHDQARAEELAVDVFLKWWRSPSAHGDHAEGWLYRSAVRKALDELRRLARRRRFEPIFARFRDVPPTPADLYDLATRQQRVRDVLARLTRRQAEILLLRSEGLSYQELARAADVDPSYVGSLLSRAQQAFRKEYRDRYGNQS